ncbi:hypothetical protein XENOCAPTIV_010786 [Xenoophorus captivus]|uniref:Uncharacterized protein n=1 Tax=Xenoophorus captivus TaxID=1517983 RepID=A0ABV0S6U0_9TELE
MSGTTPLYEYKVSSPTLQCVFIRESSSIGCLLCTPPPPPQQSSNQSQQLPVRAVSARLHSETEQEQNLLHLFTTLAQVGSLKQTHANTAIQNFSCFFLYHLGGHCIVGFSC